MTEEAHCQKKAELICSVAAASPKVWLTELSVGLCHTAWLLKEKLWAPEETAPCSRV